MFLANKFRHLEANGCVKRVPGSQRRWRAGYCFRCDFSTKIGARVMLAIKRDNLSVEFDPKLRFERKEELKRKKRGGLPKLMWKNHKAQMGYKIAGPARSEYDKRTVF